MQAEYNDLAKQIQALQLELVRQATPPSPPSKLESTKVSASPNPYPDFETTPQSWADIEKTKGSDYLSDLKQWHKDSHKSTKNNDGSPKVFYHGTRSDKFEVFEAGESESGRDGIYFSTSPKIAKDYDVWDQGLYEGFLHYKNPLEVDFNGVAYNSKEGREILKTIPQKLSKDHDAIIYKNIRDDNQHGAGELADTIVVFNPNQIKHIENRGVESERGRKYFNSSSPNIFHSNPHLGAGLLGGSVAGVEQDENGQWKFSPEKFALGLLGGAAGSKAVAHLYTKGQQQKAQIAIKSIAKDYEALSKNNPLMFAKMLQNFKAKDILQGKAQVEKVSKEFFNKELAQAIESAISSDRVGAMPQARFHNREEFGALFDSVQGRYGVIKTPIGVVKCNIAYAWNHFKHNTYNTNRDNIKGGFFKTFRDPLFIVEQVREGQSSPSVYFYKPFFDKDKQLMNLFGIGIQGDKVEFKTYYLDTNGSRMREILHSKIKILYMQER